MNFLPQLTFLFQTILIRLFSGMEMNEVYKLKDIFCHIKAKTPHMPGLNETNMQQPQAHGSIAISYKLEALLLRWRFIDYIKKLLEHPRTALFLKSHENTLLAWTKITKMN